MIITTTTETKYKVEMTARQRESLIIALLIFADKENGLWPDDPFSKEQIEVMDDLRVSLLNAA